MLEGAGSLGLQPAVRANPGLVLINLFYRCFLGRIRQALWLEDFFLLRPLLSSPLPLPEHQWIEERGKLNPQLCELEEGSEWQTLFSGEKKFCKTVVKEGENKTGNRTDGGGKSGKRRRNHWGKEGERSTDDKVNPTLQKVLC